MVLQTSYLTSTQLNDVFRLHQQCALFDGNAIPIYPHLLSQPRLPPGHFLYYDKELLGVASIYFFYEKACEVALFIKPSARRQGLAKQLLQAVCHHLKEQRVHHLIASFPGHRQAKWLKKKHWQYLHSEYTMQRTLLSRPQKALPDLHNSIAKAIDVSFLCEIDKLCFPLENCPSAERYHQLIASSSYEIMIIWQENKPIGKAHLHWQSGALHISDVAVLPAQQGKGVGQTLLAYCIDSALDNRQSTLTLNVHTNNEHALNLYKRLEFSISNTCDYWSIPLSICASIHTKT